MTKKLNNGCLLCLTRDDAKGYDFKTINVRTKRVNLKQLQSAVGGYIELARCFNELKDHNIDAWVDDEGKIKLLEPTIFIEYKNKITDYLAGNIVFTKTDKNGDSLPLQRQDIKIIKDYFNKLNRKSFTNYMTGKDFECLAINENQYL